MKSQVRVVSTSRLALKAVFSVTRDVRTVVTVIQV